MGAEVESVVTKVSDLVAETLEKLDVKHAFGIIGAGNVHLFEAIARRGFTEVICVHHEQVACMAMQTYYRMHGKIAVALLTTGAGSTNGVTGVVSAWADSIPGVVIAGNENSKFTKSENQLRMWGVQGYDSVEMVRRVTKYGVRTTNPEEVVFELQKAFQIAVHDRPGPCWVEIPMDIQAAKIPVGASLVFADTHKLTEILSSTLKYQLDAVISKIKTSSRPVVWLGNGVRLSGAQAKVATLIESLGVPCLVSWAGIDMVDSNHRLVYGRAGVYGQRAANFVLQNSDYVLAIGTRLAIPQIGYDLTELAREAVIDVVDIDSLEAAKHSTRVREPIVCDASFFIDQLTLAIKENDNPNLSDWIAKCDYYRQYFPWIGPEHADMDGYINSYGFMERLNGFLKDNQIVVTDMGTALLCSHQVLRIRPGQRLMTSTGLGEMGFGLPAAIGASFATDRGEVMCLNCDGGMMMNLQELQTIVHHKLPIKIFIFNNDGYLMIKHTQNALFKSGYVGTNKSSGVSCPNYSKIAFAFDMPAYQIRSWDECDEVIAKVQAEDGPVICEVFMHPEQLFVPKLSLVQKEDGSLVSPPLEDLSPLLPRSVLEEAMLIGLHQKSLLLGD